MNKIKQPWQNIDYVYRFFADHRSAAQENYRGFIEKGVYAGRRPELTGGGLLRSSGGWTGLKGLSKAGIRVKGDERILGDSDFVENVLKSAEESLEGKYALKALGYDFDQVVSRVAHVLAMTPGAVTAFGKSPSTVKARALLCYWTQRKLGMHTIEIAGKLRISQPAVSRLAQRGEKIARAEQFDHLPSGTSGM